MNPLQDDTRAQICSSLSFISNSPFAEVASFSLEKDVHSYNGRSGVVETSIWENWSPTFGKTFNRTVFEDVFILADFTTPKCGKNGALLIVLFTLKRYL
jgi:hypothetical protein